MSTAEVEVPVVTTTPVPTLTAADRCDRCGAQAYLLAVHPDAGELRFCAHHSREHEQGLRDKGFIVAVDQRPELV